MVQVDKRSRAKPSDFFDLPPALVFVYLMSALTGATSFYAYRVYRLSSKPLLALVPWLGNVARLVLTLTGVVFALRIRQTVLNFMLDYGWYLKGSFFASAAVDVWNTTTLCVILARHRQGPQTKHTIRVLNKLILGSIEIGLITSIIAVIVLIAVRWVH
ncbi:hypothetical protein AURDEDRAFT_127756 [Auricularia subglabra TFB-10046 SS5]|nr:hypothetical protein AURDEDRAFT_127756 [Auricularia subglabra TFB-10046 SS5]